MSMMSKKLDDNELNNVSGGAGSPTLTGISKMFPGGPLLKISDE